MMLSYHYAIEFAKEQKEVFGGDMGAFLDVAIECIEKQMPKKCRHNLPNLGHKYKYCPFCGQAIDWSDEE